MSGENLEQERWTTYNGVKVSRPWRVQKAGNEHRQCVMNCADSLLESGGATVAAQSNERRDASSEKCVMHGAKKGG